ncbi:TetR/AcrR family transcriptional regulator [Aeromicrobium ginsengisoli]|uniref:TetR/AcrR family transcriptional regulator n=1 Tax=Aeromicrobium ginsengisoli TaxID=363867 RepID=A0A5M4FEP6_9ACTN|nr:TetR/AcrR family transcriptional regulator [Aeromicrobium ginsengisoli]KAA1397825.1 TetR/AcrR family transcriptional regulator [Aeromicrobium ginsengisoli]
MSEELALNDPQGRLVQATVRLLAEQGPSALKARTIASEAGVSTMVVYHHFGGIPELYGAVIDFGFAEIENAFVRLPVTDDPVADLFSMALTVREIARANPHLYDMMFGLSTRASYRPTSDKGVRRSGHSAAFQAAYAHITAACARLAGSEQVGMLDPETVAAGLWSTMHGFISLELADHFVEFEDPVRAIMVPIGVVFTVGLGADLQSAQASHDAALRCHEASTLHSL